MDIDRIFKKPSYISIIWRERHLPIAMCPNWFEIHDSKETHSSNSHSTTELRKSWGNSSSLKSKQQALSLPRNNKNMGLKEITGRGSHLKVCEVFSWCVLRSRGGSGGVCFIHSVINSGKMAVHGRPLQETPLRLRFSASSCFLSALHRLQGPWPGSCHFPWLVLTGGVNRQWHEQRETTRRKEGTGELAPKGFRVDRNPVIALPKVTVAILPFHFQSRILSRSFKKKKKIVNSSFCIINNGWINLHFGQQSEFSRHSSNNCWMTVNGITFWGGGVKMLVAQSCLSLCDSRGCSPPGSSVCGILQAKILEWVAISFSRGSSRSWDRTQVLCIAGRFFTVWATREACLAGGRG